MTGVGLVGLRALLLAAQRGGSAGSARCASNPPGRLHHEFQLIGLPADYDLFLHDAAGEHIASTTLEGTRSETIVQTSQPAATSRFSFVAVMAGAIHAGGAHDLAGRVAEGVDVDYRVATLGHVQRGEAPSMRDLVLGAILGDAAVTALCDDAGRVMVARTEAR